MSDTTDALQAMRAVHQEERAGRRAAASEDFQVAADRARDLGLDLCQCSEFHYQLRQVVVERLVAGTASWRYGWIINLYPGNQRVWSPAGHQQGPYLALKRPWRLVDAVEAAGRAIKRG